MTQPIIALFANAGSRQLAVLAELVAEQGAKPVSLDIQLGGAGQVSVTMGPERLQWGGLDFHGIRAVHVRCTAVNTPPAMPPMVHAVSYNDWRTAFLREQHYQATSYSFFEELSARGVLVVNRLTGAYVDHGTKGQLMLKLADWGFPVPRTLTTNDPEAAQAFFDAVGEAVVKPAMGIGSTRVVAPADRERLDEIGVTPVLFQERIRGRVVRIHIVGDRVVLALRVIGEHVDSRTLTQGFEYHEMPEEEQARIVAANRRLGLHYAAWDAIHTADGRYVYLDCNPGPYIMWIGPEYVRVVLTELARYLVTFSRGGSLEEASRAVQIWREHA